MENKEKSSVFKSRKFKYGSLSVALTVLFIVLIIVFNAAVYALTYSFGWYLDLTGGQYYGITDASKELLDGVLTPGVNVQIVFCQDKDRVLEDAGGYYVYKCIESYKKAYPNNISVKFLDINKHPELASQYTTQHGIKLYTYNVIMETNVDNGDSPNLRVFDYDDFYIYDQETSQVYAFHGENRFTSYIISLCHEFPKCYFITGHGETVTDGSGNYGHLYEFMEDAGFDVREIDLSKPEATLTDAKVIIINDPLFDYSTAELDKIGQFMNGRIGNAMVFLSPDNALSTDPSRDLVNLKGWLRDWGIEVIGQISDNVNSMTDSNGLSILAAYPLESESSFAASLHKYMRQKDSQPKTVIDNALAFKCAWPTSNISGAKEYQTVLYTYDTASVGDYNNKQLQIASLVRYTQFDHESESQLNSYLFVSSVGYEKYLSSSVYGNRDILFMLAKQMGKVLVPLGIDMKVFGSEELSITTAAAYVWTVILVGVMPAAVLTVGGVICFRRRRF